jgi:putative endopeptidase
MAVAFPPQVKYKAIVLLQELEAALGRQLSNSHAEWLDVHTKHEALIKLAQVGIFIGPSQGEDTDHGVEVSAGEYARSVFALRVHRSERLLRQLFEVPDEGIWFMTAPTGNAYYTPQTNALYVPAGELLHLASAALLVSWATDYSP